METKTIFNRFPVLKTIPPGKFPKNIFIIPDGNGRWAKQRGFHVTQGHKKGFHVAETLLDDLSQIPQIKQIGLWGFSTDNWKREKKEVAALMHIFSIMVDRQLKIMRKINGRFIHLGRKDRIPKILRKKLEKAEKETEVNIGKTLYIAIDFGGEDEVVRVLEKFKSALDQNVTPELLWKLRDGEGIIKSADLLIRTSGELRTSDVGWLNGASTELYFTKKYFPDIETKDIVDAIVSFSKRERRFGGRTL